MTHEEYDRFLDALLEAQSVEAKEWEKLNYFEGCLPIEEIARRGRDTLRFGPMKPVGLRDPRTGHMPYAVVQLRQENLRADSYNLVGFQNHLKFGEQARVLRMIPGLENAKFLRYGQIHRNTYINGPTLLRETLQMKQHPNVIVRRTDFRRRRLRRVNCNRLAGGMAAARWRTMREPMPPPRATAFGALVNYICHADAKNFQPANITFDLLLPLDEATRRRVRDKKQRHAMVCQRALAELRDWLENASSATGHGWRCDDPVELIAIGVAYHESDGSPSKRHGRVSLGSHGPTRPHTRRVPDAVGAQAAHGTDDVRHRLGRDFDRTDGRGRRRPAAGSGKSRAEFRQRRNDRFCRRTSLQAGGARAGRRVEFEDTEIPISPSSLLTASTSSLRWVKATY